MRKTHRHSCASEPDDISGYLVQEILSQQDSPVQLSEQSMEGYEFQDC